MKVLIVEDEVDVIMIVKRVFEFHGIKCIEAKDGIEGIKLAIEEKPDLVLLDIVMPGVSGFEVCRRLKEEERTHSIPIAILTAKNQEEDRLLGVKVGADFYITKPFDVIELIEKIREVLKRRGNDSC